MELPEGVLLPSEPELGVVEEEEGVLDTGWLVTALPAAVATAVAGTSSGLPDEVPEPEEVDEEPEVAEEGVEVEVEGLLVEVELLPEDAGAEGALPLPVPLWAPSSRSSTEVWPAGRHAARCQHPLSLQ